MNPDVAALLAVQADDQAINALEGKLAALEPRLRDLDRQRKAAEESLARARAQAEAEERRQRELQGRTEEHRHLQERNTAQLEGIRSARQASAAMSQVDQSRRMLAEDESELQAVTRRVIELHEVIRVHERALEDVLEAQTASRAEIAEERRKIEDELRHERMKRDGSATRVSRNVLAQYDRIRRRKPDRAVVALRGGSCGSCDMNVPLQRRNEMQRTGAIEMCEGCGVLLFAGE